MEIKSKSKINTTSNKKLENQKNIKNAKKDLKPKNHKNSAKSAPFDQNKRVRGESKKGDFLMLYSFNFHSFFCFLLHCAKSESYHFPNPKKPNLNLT